MNSIAIKKPFTVSMYDFAAQSNADALQLFGQALPCHVVDRNGAIVTVAFDVTTDFTLPQVTCPILESQYVKLPIQVGDRGITIPASVSLGEASGLGGKAPPSLTQPANLGALVFVPIGNANWSNPDENAVIVTAPNGAIIQTTDGTTKITVSETVVSIVKGSTSITTDGTTVTISGTTVNINGTLNINGNPYLAHKHGGVTTGTSATLGVTP